MQAHAESFAPLVLSAAALDCDFVNPYMNVYIITSWAVKFYKKKQSPLAIILLALWDLSIIAGTNGKFCSFFCIVHSPLRSEEIVQNQVLLKLTDLYEKIESGSYIFSTATKQALDFICCSILRQYRRSSLQSFITLVGMALPNEPRAYKLYPFLLHPKFVLEAKVPNITKNLL